MAERLRFVETRLDNGRQVVWDDKGTRISAE